MVRPICIFFLLAFSLHACVSSESEAAEGQAVETESTENLSPAEKIVQKCIETHGSNKFNGSKVSFEFRGRQYLASRNDGLFRYERITDDPEKGRLHDVLTNDALTRTINGEVATLTSKDSAAYARSVNSVVYFALLPYFLSDPAVQMEYLEETTFREKPYHKIKVTFRQQGGGRDYEDEYIYWIHQDNFTLDYLAYNYVVDGGGARFREAYNVQTVNGIRFADYINYKPEGETREVATFDQLLEEGKMKELSRIETENIVVEP